MRITHAPYERSRELKNISFKDISKGPDGVYMAYEGGYSFLTKKGHLIYWAGTDELADDSWLTVKFTYEGMEKP